ncbi:MAG: organic solvent tolerance protein OstA, partial [Bacteroidales bacterium]|nr:organic solvent tolerance protein OstA [Bacteroidales bacterium]
DRLELNNIAFVVSQVDPDKFNQIKGRNLTGFFRNNELYRINIDGNGETIYYLVDGDRLVGINKAKCSKIEIYVKDGKITEIYEYDNPEGVIDPPLAQGNDSLKLEGFLWLDSLRPRNKNEIFAK